MTIMTQSRLKVAKFGGYVGAIVTGVDLREEQDESIYAEIRRAFDEHGVIFMPDQDLTMAQYVAFGKHLGDLAVGDGQPHAADLPELQVMAKEKTAKLGIGDTWHADQTWRANPTKGTVLRSVELPPYGGDTLFLSAAAAFDALPESMKEMLRGLNAVHSRPFIMRENRLSSPNEKRYRDITVDEDRFAIHPVVMRHPATNRELLFVNPGYTSNFEGWTETQSRPLLEQIYAHCFQPEFQCRYRWSVNAIAYWDNRQVWHYAANDYHGHRREMHRLMVQ